MEKKARDNVSCFFYFCHLNSLKMGRGDKRTKRGKIAKGTFGRRRPAKVKAVKSEKKA